MINLKVKIWNLYDEYEQLNDTLKDKDGKGLLQRFNEAVVEEYDTNVDPLVTNFVDNILNVDTIYDKFIPLLESVLGEFPTMASSFAGRRKLMKFALKLYTIKGSVRAYEVMFRLIGMDTFLLEEFPDSFGLDSTVTLDDEVRVFDNFCTPCVQYDITLTGTLPVSNDLISFVRRVINFNEPITARVRTVLYNGDELPISVSVPATVLSLDSLTLSTISLEWQDLYATESNFILQEQINGVWQEIAVLPADTTNYDISV